MKQANYIHKMNLFLSHCIKIEFPLGANHFLLEYTPFQKAFAVQKKKKKKKVVKSASLVKMPGPSFFKA